jgi:hypothetical protein
VECSPGVILTMGEFIFFNERWEHFLPFLKIAIGDLKNQNGKKQVFLGLKSLKSMLKRNKKTLLPHLRYRHQFKSSSFFACLLPNIIPST